MILRLLNLCEIKEKRKKQLEKHEILCYILKNKQHIVYDVLQKIKNQRTEEKKLKKKL